MRLWEVKFEVHKALKTLPRPGEIVLEKQFHPSYHLEGSQRQGTIGGQFVCTIQGEGCFRGGSTVTRLTPGTAFLHNHTDADTAYYYPPDGVEPWIFLWISFFHGSIENIIRDINERYGYIFHLPTDSALIKRLQSYQGFHDTIQILTPLAGGGLVMRVLTDIGEYAEKDLISDPQSNLVRRAQQMIMENLSHNITINDIAKEIKVSREHLSRVFKEQAGMPPQQYIQKMKMRYAGNLLRRSDLSCKEIAERLGYDNQAAFTRAFKNIFKISPSAMRESGVHPIINF